MIQSGGSFCSWLGTLSKKALTNVAIPLVRDNLPGLVTNIATNAINRFERKMSRKWAARAERGPTLFISDEDMNDSIKVSEYPQKSKILKASFSWFTVFLFN